jgi:DNA polymerase-3 subunit delta'
MHSNWDTVIGQARVKRIVQAALRQRRIAHAYLFWGSEGVGADAIAIEFARALLCETGTDSACGTCASCKKIVTLQHPDLKLIFPLPGGDGEKNEDGESVDADVMEEIRRQTAEKAKNPYFRIEIPKAKVIRIKSIREIKRESSMSSTEMGKKVFLIFDADAMNDAAANSLLKILEEPLEHVHFILATSRKDQLKPTIISRSQLIHCGRLTDGEIADALTQRENVEKQQAHFVSRLSGGSYLRALQLLNEDLSRYRTDAVSFLRSVLGPSPLRFFDEQEEYMTGNKRNEAENLLMMLLVFFRDALMVREQSTTVFNIDQTADLDRFVGKFGHRQLEQCLTAVERSLELLRRNVYLPLIMLSVLVHIRTILDAK